jgi:hypothetical protein
MLSNDWRLPLGQPCLLKVNRIDFAICELSQLYLTKRKSLHAAQSEVVPSLARQICRIPTCK